MRDEICNHYSYTHTNTSIALCYRKTIENDKDFAFELTFDDAIPAVTSNCSHTQSLFLGTITDIQLIQDAKWYAYLLIILYLEEDIHFSSFSRSRLWWENQFCQVWLFGNNRRESMKCVTRTTWFRPWCSVQDKKALECWIADKTIPYVLVEL